MSLVEQQPPPRDHDHNHVDFIPDSHVVEGQDRDRRKSYRRSLSSSPRPHTPPSNTDNTTTDADDNNNNGTKMDPFNDDMLSTYNTKRDDAVQAPALPAKSALRASRLLATLPVKLATDIRPVLTPAAPHILYLSSEEDASSSADDFSDCDYNSDNEDSQETPQQRTSHEDTARMVSVVFSGKPSIVELPRRSISPSSSREGHVGDLVRTSTEPMLVTRAVSASSTCSAVTFQHPPRSSSMISTTTLDKKHQFLSHDPFATKLEHDEPEAQQSRRATTMFKRTLSLVRKRSRPLLNPAAVHSRENLGIPSTPMEQVGEGKAENHVSESRASTPRLPSTYQDIINSARRTSYSATSSPVSEIPSPLSPKKSRNPFTARRRSIRI